MAGAERLDVIRASRHFAGWPDHALECLLPYVDEVAVRAGDRLATEGELGHEFALVAEGRLETWSNGRRGELGPGDSFGWSAMHRRRRNEASVIAATDARLLVMSHAQFRTAVAPPPSRRYLRLALLSSRRSLRILSIGQE